MSDKLTGPLSLESYLNKQEGLLIESIRRHLQAEVKVSLLESAIQELYKKNEELNAQLEINKTTIEQSINGLQGVTLERNELSAKVSELKAFLDECNSERNSAAILNDEIKRLNSKLQVATDDYARLKENYNIVLAALEDTKKTPVELDGIQNSVETVTATKKKSKVRKTQETGSEWLDGEYKVST